MSSTPILLLNGLMLALGMSFMLILLLANIRGEINQFFALFWLMLLFWHTGALLVQVSELVTLPDEFTAIAGGMMELGFSATSVALYALTTALVSVLSRRARLMMFASIGVLIALRTLTVVMNAPALSPLNLMAESAAEGRSLYILFYLLFDGATLLLLWQSRRRLRSAALMVGIALFAVGQGIGFLNPALGTHITSLFVSAIGGLVLSFAILQQEIIKPLAERTSQVDAVRDLSRSITSRDPLDHILDEVTQQAAGLLQADAVGLFLFEAAHLRLAAGVRLPAWFYSAPQVGGGMAHKSMNLRQALRVDDYARDWKGAADLPYARETFGSVMAAPLVYGGEVIGAMLVIAGKHSRLYGQEDVYLLQLLTAQVSVAIANHRMLSEQHVLTEQIELARGQLEAVLVSTESPVIALDRNFRLIFANPAAEALFEVNAVSPASIFGYFPSRPPLLPPEGRSALHTIRQQRSLTYEIPFHNRTYLCHAAPLGEERITGWVVLLNDVTELKELDRMKSEMVRMTSHDLKNPLQAAMANLELLRDDLYDGADEEVRLSIDTIDKQFVRMNRIISGILDLERLKSGRMAMEACQAAEIAALALQEVSDAARERQIALSLSITDALPVFAGDAEQLSRALVNLLENAVKFTSDRGSVRLEVRRDKDEILFAVMDTGVGIPLAQQVHVFERFFRANQRGVEHVTGTGLGLSLVKAVAESHRGRVWLDSTEGVGSTFFITIPIAASPGVKLRNTIPLKDFV